MLCPLRSAPLFCPLSACRGMRRLAAFDSCSSAGYLRLKPCEGCFSVQHKRERLLARTHAYISLTYTLLSSVRLPPLRPQPPGQQSQPWIRKPETLGVGRRCFSTSVKVGAISVSSLGLHKGGEYKKKIKNTRGSATSVELSRQNETQSVPSDTLSGAQRRNGVTQRATSAQFAMHLISKWFEKGPRGFRSLSRYSAFDFCSISLP